jgi:deoxyadenosine/deoxycytidine kinase
MYFFIEGNIGSGKSSLLHKIASTSSAHATCVQEPVGEWAKMLDLFYQDMKKHAFAFQANAMVTRIAQLAKYATTNKDKTIVSERSPASGYIFAASLASKGYISADELTLYKSWSEASNDAFPPSGIVYLKVHPEECMRRMSVRNRACEADVDVGYLTDLHDRHEAYMDDVTKRGVPVLVLTSADIEENAASVLEFVSATKTY